jgi:hypothetical protein
MNMDGINETFDGDCRLITADVTAMREELAQAQEDTEEIRAQLRVFSDRYGPGGTANATACAHAAAMSWGSDFDRHMAEIGWWGRVSPEYDSGWWKPFARQEQ